MKSNFLSIDQAILRAPSIAAKEPVSAASERYVPVHTTDMVEALQKNGWGIISASEQKVRTPDRQGFQKHIVTFGASALQTYEEIPTIALINSADRTTKYTLLGGIHVFVCTNGLIISKKTLDEVKFKHQDITLEQVTMATERMGFKLRQTAESIDSMRNRELNNIEQIQFATKALEIRYGDIKRSPIGTTTVLEPRREADTQNNLWKIFNRVQENIIRGGQSDHLKDVHGRSLGRSQPIKSIDRDILINTQLWDLAESFKN
jgi:hypothetical protein